MQNFKIDDPKNNYKNVAHAFFLSLALTIAEPFTILPLMIHHFSQSTFIVGLFASLLRGGAIVIQLYAAFHAQEYKRVLPYIKKVFLLRFFAWFMIGFSILLIGDKNKTLTLVLMGLFLFLFSFSAGFGAIYFKELQAKLFSKSYRGKTMANRNIAGSIASIISGGVAGYILSITEAPMNYGYLFVVSSLFMLVGFVIFSTADEPSKEKVLKKEKRFGEFLQNAKTTLKNDNRLKRQIVSMFLSFSYLMSMPFVILEANSSLVLNGWMLGGFIMMQMFGSIIGSGLLWRQIDRYGYMLFLSFAVMIVAIVMAWLASGIVSYVIVFLLFGVAKDGISIANMNLIIELAPQEKRPLYTAISTNLSSFGLFFPLVGGTLLGVFGSYEFIYLLTIILLAIGALVAYGLEED